jgi:hypothetical protein
MSNPEPTTGTAMLSQSSGRVLIVFANGTPIDTTSIDSGLIISNESISNDKPKSVKYPSQKVINKYRTPKIPKNNRK